MRYRRIPNLGQDYVQIIERVNILERLVQSMGFTPDFPYTLNVNDGTRNRVLIGKIGSDYGIKIVNSTGVEIVFADGHISATGITTGTLDASIVTVTNLSASSITTGTLSASKISGGTLDCSLMTVSNLSANSITTGTMSGDRISTNTLDANRIKSYTITATQLSSGELITQSAQIKDAVITNSHINDLNAGKITAGSISADRMQVNVLTALKYSVTTLDAITANLGTITAGSITGVTITGGTVRTATSGSRVQMTAAENEMAVYNGSDKIIQVDEGGMWIRQDNVIGLGGTSAAGQQGQIYYDTAGLGGLCIDSNYNVNISSDKMYVWSDISISGTGSFGGDVEMNNYMIKEIKYLSFNTASNSSTSGYLWFYNAGSGNYYWRSRNGSWNGQFDQTSF